MDIEQASYLFRVGEGPDRGKPVFILLELVKGPPISVFENALVSLRLRDEDSFEKAREVADFLNDHIRAIQYQPFD